MTKFEFQHFIFYALSTYAWTCLDSVQYIPSWIALSPAMVRLCTLQFWTIKAQCSRWSNVCISLQSHLSTQLSEVSFKSYCPVLSLLRNRQTFCSKLWLGDKIFFYGFAKLINFILRPSLSDSRWAKSIGVDWGNCYLTSVEYLNNEYFHPTFVWWCSLRCLFYLSSYSSYEFVSFKIFPKIDSLYC